MGLSNLKIALLISVSVLLPRGLEARSLSDLEVFTRTIQAMEKTYSDPKQRAEYHKALEAYGGKEKNVTRDFEKVFTDLHKLWAQVDGVDRRLTKTGAPLAFAYRSSDQSTFKFERVSQPFHGVWLLQNLKETNTDACSERDTLLIDRWTPLLRDTSVFAIEKNGTYLGTTLTLVPIKNLKQTFLLVVPSGKEELLPKSYLEAFLKDYQTKNRPKYPFALLSKLSKSRYQIDELDAEGRVVGNLGPLTGFTLEDPIAKRLVSVANVKCSPYSTDVADSQVALGAGGGKGAGEPGIIINALSNSSSNPSLSANANSALSNPSGLSGNSQKGTLNSEGAGNTNPSRDPASIKGPTTITNTVTNNYGNLKDVPVQNTAEKFGSGNSNPSAGGSAGKGFSYLPPGFGGSASSGGSGSTGGVGSTGGGNNGGSFDPSRLSPQDKEILKAVEKAERDLQNNADLPRKALDEINRGADRAQNPEVRKRAEQCAFAAYFKNDNAMEAYNSIKENFRDLPKLAQQLEKDLCDHCKNCEYCKLKPNERGSLAKPWSFALLSLMLESEAFAHDDRTNHPTGPRRAVAVASNSEESSPYQEKQFAPCGENPAFPSCGDIKFKMAFTAPKDDSFAPTHPSNNAARCSLLAIQTIGTGGKTITKISKVIPRKDKDKLEDYTIVPGTRLGAPYKAKVNYMIIPNRDHKQPFIIIPGPCTIQDKDGLLGLALINGSENKDKTKTVFESLTRECEPITEYKKPESKVKESKSTPKVSNEPPPSNDSIDDYKLP